MTTDEKYMSRCLELAQLGLGNIAPNPMVGSVIVHKDKIIGEGYHHQFGKEHAEVNAINSVKNQNLSSLQNAILYVNLEPCSHVGKTPPCVDLIIQKKISKIIIATADPNPLVKGNGIKKLREAGCDVKLGILEKEARELNKRFFTFHQQHRPYIILKWAQTTDGFISSRNFGTESKKWISNESSRKLGHKWRSEEQAIMVGTNTALLDNPQLNVRLWKGKNPIRMVIDKDLKLPKRLHLFDQTISTIVLTAKKNVHKNNLDFVQLDFSKNIVKQISDWCYDKQIQSVMIEGGRKLLSSFIEENQWDEARVFVSNKNFSKGIAAPKINGELISEENIAGDKLLIFKS